MDLLHVPAFPLGFKISILPFIKEFFDITGMAYAQAMPEVWRILMVCNKIIENHGINLHIGNLSYLHKFKTHGSNRYVLQLTKILISCIMSLSLTGLGNQSSFLRRWIPFLLGMICLCLG